MRWRSLKKWEAVKEVEELGMVGVVVNLKEGLKFVGIVVGDFLNCKMIVG